MAHECLVEEVSKETVTFFGKEAQKRIFKDHLNNTHTAIEFGTLCETCLVKFHNVEPDINLFLNDDKLNSMLKAINFLESKGGVLIFLDNTHENKETMKDFGIGAQILNTLGVKEIKLLTSGGKYSFVGLTGFGLTIKEEIPIS
jgi:3,4-dihydroxy 2-butanone 4-phosphate synthase/GTP cyclohydrolase II